MTATVVPSKAPRRASRRAKTELEFREEVISQGLHAFVEVAGALREIRDYHFYKDTHETFETYCLGRWGFTQRRAQQLIAAAKVANNCSPYEHQKVPYESHARELGKLPSEEQPKAWQEAIAMAPNGVVTAKHVASVVAARLPARSPRTVPQAATSAAMAPALSPVRTFVVVDLEQLIAQRNANQEFAQLRDLQKTVNNALGRSHAQRMLDFIVDGGELALLRLGLDWNVTEETLKRAFRARSLEAHPDRGGLQEEFVALTQANQLVLTFLGVAS